MSRLFTQPNNACRRSVAATLSILCGVLLLGCTNTDDAHQQAISRADLGDKWPLMIDSGTLECRNGAEVVLSSGGTLYALNGTAKSRKLYADVTSVWADDPSMAGLKVSIGPLIDEGLSLC